MKDTIISNNHTHEIGTLKSYSNRVFSATFKTDPELWSRFKSECKFRGVSIGHVLEALMEAWIQGQKAQATVVKPVVVNLTMQHIVERPRRKMSRVEMEGWDRDRIRSLYPGVCWRLTIKGDFPGRIGFCTWIRKWIEGVECETCIFSGE